MKKRVWLGTMALLLGSVTPGMSYTADEVVAKVLNTLAPGEWQGEYIFTNYRTDQTQRSYTLKIAAKNRNLLHLSFLAPAREAGRQILNKNGELWTYLPDSQKVIRLADRESLANGDFNNADVMKMNWQEDYDANLTKESTAQWVIDLQAKPDRKPVYYHIRLWVLKKDIQPVQQYFYDETGHHLKTLKYRKVKDFGGVARPAEMSMENVVTNQKTVLQIVSFAITDKLPMERFTQEALGK